MGKNSTRKKFDKHSKQLYSILNPVCEIADLLYLLRDTIMLLTEADETSPNVFKL